MTAAAQIDTMLSRATTGAACARKRVERLVKLLTDEMQNIHGGSWKAYVDHEADVAMVMIVPRVRRK